MMRFVISLLAFLIASPALAVDYTKNIVTDYGAVCQARAVTIDIATSTFIAPNHGLPNDRAVHFFTTGTSPTASIGNTSATKPGAAGTSNVPLATVVGQANGAAVYLTRNVTADTFQIYYKPTSATPTTPVTLSGSQSGTFTFDTDARPAFEAFNTWAKTVTTDSNTITLEIPAGSDCVTMTGSATMTAGRIGLGLKKFVMNGNNSIYESYNPQNAGTIFQLGGGGIYQDNVHGARLNYVAKGATSITAMNPADVTTTRGFVVGRWIMISGIDMMAYGFPQNPYYFEYAKITSVNYVTGEVGIDRATKRFYKPTWPHYSDGGASANQGGYAYAYTMYPEWDSDLTYNDLQIRQYFPVDNNASGTSTGSARKVTLNNITILDGGTKNTSGVSKKGSDSCLSPTIAREILTTNINAPLCNAFEMDKIVEYMLIKDSYIGGLGFQSSSFRVVDVDNSKIGNINGTPQIINIKNGSVIGGTVGNVAVGTSLVSGATQYGRTEQVNCSNSILYPNFGVSNRTDLDTRGGLAENLQPESSTGFSITSGVIRLQKYPYMAPVTIDIPTSTFTATAHGMADDTAVKFLTTGTLPSPLVFDSTYLVTNATANTFQVKIVGGTTPITLSGSQSGTQQLRGGSIRPAKWAIPDTNLRFLNMVDNSDYIQSGLQSFHILDVYGDYDYVYIQTDLTRTGWPASSGTNNLLIKVHPAPSMTFYNCTGSDIAAELSKAPSGTPLMSYINRTFTADRMKQGAEGINVWGKITSMTTNVVKAWPQSTNFSVWPLSVTGWYIYDATGTRPNYNPVLNSKVEGLRNIFPAPATPKSGDSFPTLAISAPYYVSTGYNIGSQVKSPSMLPIVQLQVTLDQNIIAPNN